MPASGSEANPKSRLWKPGCRFEPLRRLKRASGNQLQMDRLTGLSAPQLYSQLQALVLHPTGLSPLLACKVEQ